MSPVDPSEGDAPLFRAGSFTMIYGLLAALLR
jgi:hypothetical protein